MTELTQIQVTGRIVAANGIVPQSAHVSFTLTGFDTDIASGSIVIGTVVNAEIDGVTGNFSEPLFPQDGGTRARLYSVAVVIRGERDEQGISLGKVLVPATGGPYDLYALLAEAAPSGVTVDQYLAQLQAAATEARAAADEAVELAATIGAGISVTTVDVTALPPSIPATSDFDPLTGALDIGFPVGVVEPEATVPANTKGPVVTTSDGYPVVRVVDGQLVFGDTRFNLDSDFSPGSIMSDDGYAALDFDYMGAAKLALSPEHVRISGGAHLIDGVPASGTVTSIRKSATFFGYEVDGPDYTGPVLGKVTNDWAAPHMADTPVISIFESDGQSWQNIEDYNPTQIDSEETTGEAGAAIRALSTPMVLGFRNAEKVGTVLDDGARTAVFDTISDGDQPGEFHKIDLLGGFSISQIAAIAYTRFQKRLGLPRNAVAVLGVGWPGTSSEKFLPEGSSFTYTDDSGASQTTSAVSHPTAGDYLWARNQVVRQSIADFIPQRWINRTTEHKFLSYIQGPFNDGGEAYGFMGEYRAQQDALSIPDGSTNRSIIWSQNGGRTNTTLVPFGYQAQVDFCQDNTSGNEMMSGPLYPYKLRDRIHYSAYAGLQIGERIGQSMAYKEFYGKWHPLWITNISFSGATCTLTTNRPRQCVGDLVVDTDAIQTRDQHGFTLHDVAAGANIPCTVVLSGNTITLTAATALPGTVEVGYAARGSVNPDGTFAIPQWSGVTGNIRMTGRDAPAVIPTALQPTLDHWLHAFRKNFTV